MKNKPVTTSESYSKGFTYALVCYIIWGIFPLFWHLLTDIPSLVILANRMVWSSVFLLCFCLVVNRKLFLEIIKNKQNILYMGMAGILITINWGTYIYAVNNHFVIEASLGYYINPLVNVLLGVLFFKEKLVRLEKIATLLACIGVIYFTLNYGVFPWIAFILAISMGIYGMIKKKANLPAVQALTLETLLISPIAIVYLLYTFNNHSFVVSQLPSLSIFLLIISGVVTVVPLLLFAQAIKILPYSTLGFIQYVGPTLQLLIGVFVFHEKFNQAHAVCFALIWLGLIFFTSNIIRNSYTKKRLAKGIVRNK